jgi:hypothetical protein
MRITKAVKFANDLVFIYAVIGWFIFPFITRVVLGYVAFMFIPSFVTYLFTRAWLLRRGIKTEFDSTFDRLEGKA